jgi:hypothetical protein
MSSADFLFHAESTSVQIMAGSIGWDDRDEYVDFGTAANDGHTFILVQLYAGRDYTKELTPNRAQGHKILCSMNSLMGKRVPPKDTRVLVAVPHNMEHIPGAAMIIGSYEKSATADQFTKDRVVIDYGPDVHVVIKGKSVSISSHDNEFVSVGTPRSGGTPGVIVQTQDGTGAVFQEGVASLFVGSPGGGAAQSILQMAGSLIQCLSKDGGMWQLNDKGFVTVGTEHGIIGSAVYIGKTPGPATFCAIGPGGASVSASVFISPT